MYLALFFALATFATANAAYVPGKAFDRFLTIWLENQDFAKASKNAQMEGLIKQGVLLTNYYAHTHPSQPNYIASVGGDYFGMNHDGYMTIPENVSTVVDLFETKGIEWKGYFEGVPGPGYMGEGSTRPDGNGFGYVRKHNPFISYDSINMNGSRLGQLQSLMSFQRDVAANTVPQYAHISPDMLNDGHDTSLEFAANWTDSFLAPLLNNEEVMKNTLILLTYDESETYPIPNKIVSLLLGNAIPPEKKGTTDNTFYTHYSILSTLQNNWDLPCLGRYDVGANVFDVAAAKTGYRNHPPPNVAAVNNSLSYPGYLNDNPAHRKPIPPPNLRLVGAGGVGVDEGIFAVWSSLAGELTPYDGSGRVDDGGTSLTLGNTPIYKAQAPAPAVTVMEGPTEPTGAVTTAKRSRGSKAQVIDGTWMAFLFGLYGVLMFVSY
ncbi:phosphoesterase family-domain-containing protein [Amylocarpus encephaloides]|uniref:Phosphoesterase family-domain-containing protein n=1 Tax=Amylocarpus encephaloides TaxID=45428 RepID=A0A9P8C5P4_9HELO|nr:phosphoesterase family-domain-containing protein [Amylocarpus encephaloides]